MLLSLTITRTGLSLPDLVISNDPTAGDFWLPEDGIDEPEVNYRLKYMPDSDFIVGKELVAAVEEHSAIPATIYTRAASSVALAANKATLRAALGQFAYNVTLNQDGATATYSADPCGPRWGTVDSGMLRGRIAKAVVSIPVYPIAS